MGFQAGRGAAPGHDDVRVVMPGSHDVRLNLAVNGIAHIRPPAEEFFIEGPGVVHHLNIEGSGTTKEIWVVTEITSLPVIITDRRPEDQ